MRQTKSGMAMLGFLMIGATGLAMSGCSNEQEKAQLTQMNQRVAALEHDNAGTKQLLQQMISVIQQQGQALKALAAKPAAKKPAHPTKASAKVAKKSRRRR